MKPKWLERTLIAGPFLALCTSEKEYLAAVKHLKIQNPEHWVRKDATTHTFVKEDAITCVVCVEPEAINRPLADVANLLVHEAVHVWQHFREYMGEDSPSSEFEAYSVQAIFAHLFWEMEKRRG